MKNPFLAQESTPVEDELFKTLGYLPLDVLMSLFGNVGEALQDDEREYLQKEIDFWSSVGDKSTVIDAIISAIPVGQRKDLLAFVNEMGQMMNPEASRDAASFTARNEPYGDFTADLRTDNYTEEHEEELKRKELKPVVEFLVEWGDHYTENTGDDLAMYADHRTGLLKASGAVVRGTKAARCATEMLEEARSLGFSVTVEDEEGTLYWFIETDIVDKHGVLTTMLHEHDAEYYEYMRAAGPGRPTPGYKPWDEEEDPAERKVHNPWKNTMRAPGEWTRLEETLVQDNPEEDYKYQDFFDREYAPGYAVPTITPNMEEVEDLPALTSAMQEAILAAVTPYGQAGIPRPYLMDMVLNYFDKKDPEYAQSLRDAGFDSRTRTGYSTKVVMNKLFDRISPEELYSFWNSIVNYKVLPGVNDDKVVDRYGGGAMGANIKRIYDQWHSDTDFSRIEMPDVEGLLPKVEARDINAALVTLGRVARMLSRAA